jgi:hypothetical protein
MKPDESAPRIPPLELTSAPPEGKAARVNQESGPSDDLTRGPEIFGEPPQPDIGDAIFSEPTADDLIQAALDDESQKRLWLRTIIPLLQLRSHDSDPSGRVQLAFDLMHIAACERASRLLGSDLPSEGDSRLAEHR